MKNKSSKLSFDVRFKEISRGILYRLAKNLRLTTAPNVAGKTHDEKVKKSNTFMYIWQGISPH